MVLCIGCCKTGIAGDCCEKKNDELIDREESALALTTNNLLRVARSYHRADRLTEAEPFYRQVLQREPNNAKALLQLASLTHALDRIPETIALYQQYLALVPDNAIARNNLAVAFVAQDNPDRAIYHYQQAIAVNPQCPEVYYNLGVVWAQQRQFAQAQQQYERAIAIKPDYLDAYNNLAGVLLEQEKPTEAIGQYHKMLALEPNHISAHRNLGIALLQVGDLKKGFAEYEWRWQSPDFAKNKSLHNFPQPRWNGEDLQGRTIAIYTEQGFGDAIQFIRYIPLVKARGARVIFECEPALMRLFTTVEGIDQLVEWGAQLPAFDVHTSLMSLPHLLGAGETPAPTETIPAQVPYLWKPQYPYPQGYGYTNKARLRGLESSQSAQADFVPVAPGFTLGAAPGQGDLPIKVGIVWGCKPTHGTAYKRSCSLEEFLPLFDFPGVAFYSLQKGPQVQEISQFSDKIISLDPLLHDFADTAAIIAQLDLVISIDTAVAHLAGAMGKPVWVLLPFAPDWRWMLKRTDSPWYPTMRLFRQSQLGNWSEVFVAVKIALQSFLQLAADRLYNQGNALRKQGHHEQAIALYQQSGTMQPNNANVCNNLAISMQNLQRFSEAIAYYQRASELDPNNANFYYNLGTAMLAAGRDLQEVIVYYQKATAITPHQAAYKNMGKAWRELGRIEEAIASYRQALIMEPEDAATHYGLSFALMLSGDLQNGFAEYEWRWQMPEFTTRYKKFFSRYLWDGSDLQGRRILVFAEQGFGDAIQFIRYIPYLKAKGPRVIVECRTELLRLFSTVSGVDELIPAESKIPDFDAIAPLMSLPHLLGAGEDARPYGETTIPAQVPYLYASEASEALKCLLRTDLSMKVGIVWSCNQDHPSFSRRSSSITDFLPLLELENITFYSLQKGPQVKDLEQLQGRVISLDPLLHDFADTAGAIAQLDLVISIDTSVAHLAGALGKPVWILLSFAPDWRWMLDRQDSPWYPTMRLFRQQTPGDWSDVFAAVKDALQSCDRNHKP
ncbi:MAG: tetratricopeptide repeat protein [Hormoscilla sp. GM7CHS1pb]|nr:tetratricopeptide repeat protein [Hormoscilla sp. GM7CHS1pb]